MGSRIVVRTSKLKPYTTFKLIILEGFVVVFQREHRDSEAVLPEMFENSPAGQNAHVASSSRVRPVSQ
jgi:hypothetical protein